MTEKNVFFVTMIALMIFTVTLMFIAKEYALLIAILCTIDTCLVMVYDKLYDNHNKFSLLSILIWGLNAILWWIIYFKK